MAPDSILHGNVALPLPWVLLLGSDSQFSSPLYIPSFFGVQHRNRLSTALATIICSRPSEVAHLQSCDFWPDFRIPGYKGTAALNIKKKKNDSDRRGQLAAIGKSKNPDLDLVQQLKYRISFMGLSPHQLCQK